MRKFLLFLLFAVLVVALFYKSPFSALYNYNKAKALYDTKQYEQSLPYFERSLFADSKGVLARVFYVLALSKSKPTYSVQKKLYEMSISPLQDEASSIAKTQVRVLRRNLLNGLSDNYISNAVYGNDILRWDIRTFPLKVYFEGENTVPVHYVEAINLAMNLWTTNTNFVKFQKVNSSNEANIVVSFKDVKKEECDKGVCNYVVAYTEPSIDNKLLKRMNLVFYKTDPLNKDFSKDAIFNTAVHELGHTLGIMGHSDRETDLMHAQKDNSLWYGSFRKALSLRDLQTLVLLYRIEPTITNVENLKSESFYYAPIILGSNDEMLEKKLKEFKDYVQKYPEIAAGYINMASVYSDMGDFEQSLKVLELANMFAKTTDELYIVHYNKAITYYNLQDYDKALELANSAQSIKDTQDVKVLISDIERIKSGN